MRASKSEQTGGSGVNEVAANFERIGWGPVPNTLHDLGTDLFVQARDERLFDRGALVGVQVKAGPSAFDKPVHDAAGRLSGWWYYESDTAHFDDWVQHGLPHLLVLHDLDTRESYWVHVTATAVVPTGKGCKIQVPLTQTVDGANRDPLLEIAARGKPSISWEGSAWTGPAPGIGPARLMRHAILAPRLVAPHANAGSDQPIGPEQAVALILQTRTFDYEQFAEKHVSVPTLSEAKSSKDWGWRFTWAVSQLVINGVFEDFHTLIDDAPSEDRRAAACVFGACALTAADSLQEANDLLTIHIDADAMGPVDHAWLLVHRARLRAEVGQVAQAREDAVAAQRSLVGDPDDVTASGIAGIAGLLLFTTAAWDAKEIDKAIIANDTTVSWWRNQTISWGLVDSVTKTFQRWGHRETSRIGGEDVANNRLLSASINANLIADHDAWRSSSSLLAQHNLLASTFDSDPGRAIYALDDLRRSGDTKSFDLAVRRTWQSGPIDAITACATNITKNSWTHTTASTNLTLWHRGGDVLDLQTATTAAQYCLSTLDDPGSFNDRIRPSFHIAKVLEALAGILGASDDSTHSQFAEMISSKYDSWTELHKEYAANCLRELRLDTLTVSMRENLRNLADSIDHRALSNVILGRLAEAGDNLARERLHARLEEGDSSALSAFGDVRDMRPEIAGQLMDLHATTVETILAQAATGGFAIRTDDPPASLALLCSWFPDRSARHWDLLVRFLAATHVPGAQKRGTCEILARRIDDVPEDVRHSLSQIAGSIADDKNHPMGALMGRQLGGAAMLLTLALGNGSDDEYSRAVVHMLSGTLQHRRDAIGLLLRADDLTGVVAMLRDANPYVRADAAGALAHAATTKPISILIVEALQVAAEDQGTLVPLAITTNLGAKALANSRVLDLITKMTTHPSASVRRRATKTLAG